MRPVGWPRRLIPSRVRTQPATSPQRSFIGVATDGRRSVLEVSEIDVARHRDLIERLTIDNQKLEAHFDARFFAIAHRLERLGVAYDFVESLRLQSAVTSPERQEKWSHATGGDTRHNAEASNLLAGWSPTVLFWFCCRRST